MEGQVFYAIFFCAGLVAGLAAGIPIIAIFWLSSKKVAEWSYRNNLLKIRAQSMKDNKKLNEEVEKFKHLYGPDLTHQQEQVLQEELAAVITNRPQGRT